MPAAAQIGLGEITKAKCPLAARVVYACLLLGTIADTTASAERCFYEHLAWDEGELRDFVELLEQELRAAGKPTLGAMLPRGVA